MTEDSGILRRNQNLHESLVSTLWDAELGLKAFPGLVQKVLQEESWRQRYVPQLEQVVTFERFDIYVTTPPLEGMGSDIAQIKHLCRDFPKVIEAIDDAIVGKHGASDGFRGNQHTKSSGKFMNHKLTRTDQSLETIIIRRLRRDFPALHKQVMSKEKAITAAAIEAGIYPKRVSVNAGNAESGADTIIKNCGAEYAAQLVDALKRRIA